MTTLRDALSTALDSAEAGTLESVPDAPALESEAPQEPASPAADRLRDEAGRFAKAQEAAAKEETKAVEPAPVEAKPEPPKRQPPSSWRKDHWTRWEKLASDPDLATLQDYILERESQAASGVHQYKSQLDQYKPVLDVLGKFQPTLQQYGIQPQQWLENLGTAHQKLALGSPEEKLAIFTKLATDYGVPLQALTGGQYDPQLGQFAQRAMTAEQQAQQALAAVQEFQASQLQQQIQAFAANKPHFEAVRETMSQLLGSGLAADLDTAYQKAVLLNDEVRKQVEAQEAETRAQQAREAEAQRQAELARKKAAAASPKSSSPTGAMTTASGKKSLRDQLAESVESVIGGRV